MGAMPQIKRRNPARERTFECTPRLIWAGSKPAFAGRGIRYCAATFSAGTSAPRALAKPRAHWCLSTGGIYPPSFWCAVRCSGSAAEDDSAKTIKRKCEIHGADYGHCDNLLPHNRQPCAAIEHILCEHNEMRRWANHVHGVLQPDRHAFHWR